MINDNQHPFRAPTFNAGKIIQKLMAQADRIINGEWDNFKASPCFDYGEAMDRDYPYLTREQRQAVFTGIKLAGGFHTKQEATNWLKLVEEAQTK